MRLPWLQLRIRLGNYFKDNWYRLTQVWPGLRTRYYARKLNKAIRVLDMLDWHMKRVGWDRQKRRQFWRDFIKRHETRTSVLNEITAK